MKKRRLLALTLAMAMTAGSAFSAMAENVETTELPRNETVYFGGQQWGTVNSYSPIGAQTRTTPWQSPQLLPEPVRSCSRLCICSTCLTAA